MNKEPPRTGAEHDWTSRWRRILCYCARAGVGKSIKRGMNKRARQRAKRELARA